MISFKSPGLIDPRCITTIGVSVKESENPIGFFGTGMKYAIAIILKAGGDITVWRGMEPFIFTKKETIIRGAPIQLVCMNGQELGFTTDLGKHWEMWMAFRELWCNTKDEGGETQYGVVLPAEGFTTIQVQCTTFDDAFREKDEFILNRKLAYESPLCSFHHGSGAGVFYRGIRVHKEETPWKFTPNLVNKQALTEDRTLRSAWECHKDIAHAILDCTDKAFLREWLTTGKGWAEHETDLLWGGREASSELKEVGEELTSDPSRTVNVYLKKLMQRYEPEPEIEQAQLLGHEELELAAAVQFCKDLGYPVDDYPIRVIESLGSNILGRADLEQRVIYIAHRAFTMGDMMLASTLIEEWVHIKHEYADCERDMQNWLFEQVTRLGKAYLHAKSRR